MKKVSSLCGFVGFTAILLLWGWLWHFSLLFFGFLAIIAFCALMGIFVKLNRN